MSLCSLYTCYCACCNRLHYSLRTFETRISIYTWCDLTPTSRPRLLHMHGCTESIFNHVSQSCNERYSYNHHSFSCCSAIMEYFITLLGSLLDCDIIDFVSQWVTRLGKRNNIHNITSFMIGGVTCRINTNVIDSSFRTQNLDTVGDEWRNLKATLIWVIIIWWHWLFDLFSYHPF